MRRFIIRRRNHDGKLNKPDATESVQFAVAERMTEKMEALIAEAEKDIKAGNLSGPFETVEEMFEHLDSSSEHTVNFIN
jgi:hypothetical protein